MAGILVRKSGWFLRPLSDPPNRMLVRRHSATIVENIKNGADSPILLETRRNTGNAATAVDLEIFLDPRRVSTTGVTLHTQPGVGFPHLALSLIPWVYDTHSMDNQ